jgi:2,5-dioxopentanoate dehydrogenase
MSFDGAIMIGLRDVRRRETFRAVNATTGDALPQAFGESAIADVAEACALAASATSTFSRLVPVERAVFLDAIADAILAIGDLLIETAMDETGLPRLRLESERGRTIGQLRMFAAEVRDGYWLDVTIDPALPERTPPRPDLRRLNIAVGPVAVFGASNFPLAFSVAGGDTASALAAGCPVVVKGHPAHPGTGELVARAIRKAVSDCGLPAGVFSFLPGTSHQLGAALVADSHIKAVGFTGSRTGGLALVEVAARRLEPIPVYAEMSSINPVLLLPGALALRAETIATAFAASLTMGSGQFCTNPGVIIAVAGTDLERFISVAGAALDATISSVMLTTDIHAACQRGVSALDRHMATVRVSDGGGALFRTDARAFLADHTLGEEVFGAASLIVACNDMTEMVEVVRALEGQLTATLHLEGADMASAAELLPLLQEKAGRVLTNGWPTGVEVCAAMVHGGPFPATSDVRTTSVGTLAMMRFLRPTCLQDVPDMLLPPPLQPANPWNVPRRIDGKRGYA